MALGGLVGHRRRAIVCAATAVVVAFGVTSAGSAQAAVQADSKSTYIVQLTGAPIASYTGDIPGLAATKPAKGTKIDTRSVAAAAYRDHLKAERNTVLAKAGLASPSSGSTVASGGRHAIHQRTRPRRHHRA